MLEIDDQRLKLKEVTLKSGDENIPQTHTSTHSERHLKLQATAKPTIGKLGAL